MAHRKLSPKRPRTPMIQRLFAGLVITNPIATHDVLGRPLIGPCLIWSGDLQNGYGRVWEWTEGNHHGRTRFTHRVMHEIFIGPIAGEPDHLCRTPACASPAHLEDVSPEENRRRVQRPKVRKCPDPVKHCRKGHPFDEANTYYQRCSRSSRGYTRRCRKCAAAQKKRQMDAIYGKRSRWKTHCLRGHPFDERNTYRSPSGDRFCRACGRINQKAYKERKRSQI
jgi:hypothetical protein